METKINIAEILKDKPNGTKLYSPLFGDVYLSFIGINFVSVKHHGKTANFYHNGRIYSYDESELSLFPSKGMRDWSKFAWKKGNLLINSCGFQCIFEEWASDDYTRFNGCYSNSRDGYEDVQGAETAKFNKLDDNIAYGYIREIEKKLGGIFNIETLEIEKKPEFKDGDIVSIVVQKCTHIAIFQSREEEYIGFHAVLCQNDELLLEKPYREDNGDIELRPANNSEKQQLFDALAKEGKAWDAEKKQIVDLPKECEFKAFDKVLVRDNSSQKWIPDMYRHYNKDEYFPHNCFSSIYKYCIPYNEETKHLLGTTDDWKGDNN
jgi:hypothetical protein